MNRASDITSTRSERGDGGAITRKKDTGEPGNKGEFGTTPKRASGLTLAPVDPTDINIADLNRMAAHGEVARRTAVALRGVSMGHELTAAGITHVEIARHQDDTFYVTEVGDADGQTHTDDEYVLGRAEGTLTRSRLTFEDLRLLSVHPFSRSDSIVLDPTRFKTEDVIKAGFAARDELWRRSYQQDLPAAS